MAESGVSRYIDGTAAVVNHFPVDLHGHASITCQQCRFYRYASSKCGLNDEVCEYPSHYVGSHCPLEFKEEIV